MDRRHWRRMALRRLRDADALLRMRRWSASYYLCGYAVECALKACLLKRLGSTGFVFEDKKNLDRLTKCWTHDLGLIVELAGLQADFGVDRGANPNLEKHWGVVKAWNEASRYEARTRSQALELYEAVSDPNDGVLSWIRARW